MIIGVDQGTSYSINVGTRQVTLINLGFDPTIERLYVVLNITKERIYYAAAESHSKTVTFTADGDNWILEYDDIYPELASGDKLHIQFSDFINVQYPNVTDGDSVYAKDIWVEESDMGNFSGEAVDLFNNLHTVITDTTANNPKEILIHFYRTIPTLVLGVGAFTGNFSNLKVIGLTSGNVMYTLYDKSADNTKRTSATIYIPTIGFNALKLQFYTADPVSISNLFILKAISGTMRIQGQKPDGDFIEFQATQSGNFKTSLEELENTVSVNANSQLRTTVFDSDGIELNIDPTTGALCTEEYSHCEIHSGEHFFIKDWYDLSNGQVLDFLAVTSNTTEWIHLVVAFNFEAEANVILYEGTTVSNTGTPVTTFNRNRNSSNTSSMLVYSAPVVTSPGTIISRYKAGSGKLVGGEDRANQELVLKQNTNYLVRVTNDTTSNNWFGYLADWYQHTNLV